MAGLDLDLTEQQVMLRDAVQRLTADIEQPGWNDLSQQLGLAGLTLPEDAGGFGGGVVDVALVMAELGPAFAGAAWLSHAAACQLLGETEPGHPLLSSLAEGSVRAALVSEATAAGLPEVLPDGRIEGTARLVAGGAEAGLFVIATAASVSLVAADDPSLTHDHATLHDGSEVSDLHFAGARSEPVSGSGSRATDMVFAGRCAEAVGLMQRMLADTADYLGQRRQFGAPIASFQALRHRLADMQLSLMQAQALTEAAVTALDREDPDQAMALATARLGVRDAARVVGEGSVQLHGAMGLTEELRLGARYKRLLVIAAGLGSEAGLTKLLAEAD